MTEAVTDIIAARSREPEGLKTMLAWSVAAHVLLVALLALSPTARFEEEPRTVMTISLGAAGPRTGGLTQMGGRAVQEPAPEEPVRRAETPPAPTRPEMTVPDPQVRPRPAARPRQAPPESTSRAPSTGEQPREGSTRTDTTVRGQGFGLSGGGGSSGTAVQVDYANFCCPAYLEQMTLLIQRNWNQNHGIVGSTTMKFTILRDGTVQQAQVERSSGFQILDDAARRAVLLARLQPLPQEFPNPTLTVHIRFEYQR